MRIDASRALGAYAAVTTLALAWMALGSAAPAPNAARFTTIDVERINVREPDGTLRLAIAGHARLPGIVVGHREYPHPNRPDAGMIFFNREGIENGGLVIDGGLRNGMPTNSGSLTFDRYRQDQTIQLVSTEEGAAREAGLIVNDRPDRQLDYPKLARIVALPPGPAKTAAFAAQPMASARRVFLGRGRDGAASLVLADAAGHQRLRLGVGKDGTPAIEFLGADGSVTRTIR